ncbi:MAG: ABC transporter ATP-binding protein [Planctomycetota bacterium]|nr:ABC transporter ATP-binding protein [Planctomycetota bacterium]
MPNASTTSQPAQGVAVTVRGASRVFEGGVAALKDVDIAIPAGQFVAILGPSGCGKSTLLRLVAGLDRPQAGTVQVEDPRDADNAKRRGPIRDDIAYVFQDAHLLPWRNVLRNVALPLELKGVDRATRLAAAREAIETVGLTDAATRYPAQLSGGMRMRVSLARALVTRPRILLLDEPFAALDELTRQRLDEQLYGLWRRGGMTVLFVTHSLSEAAFLGQRAVVFSKRPARVAADIMIDLPLDRPADLRTERHFNELVLQLHRTLEREGG